MKYKFLLIVIIVFSCSFMLSFRNISKDRPLGLFVYSFSSVDPATGKIKAALQPNTAVKQKGKGKTATAVTYLIDGSRSSVRLKFEDSYFNVLSDLQTSNLNPILYIGLYKLTTGKNGRTLVIDPNSGENVMAFNLSPLDANTQRIIVGATLQSGEYAFVDKTTTTADGNVTVWTFGID